MSKLLNSAKGENIPFQPSIACQGIWGDGSAVASFLLCRPLSGIALAGEIPD